MLNRSLMDQRNLYKKVKKNSRNPTPTLPMDHILLPPDSLKKAFTPQKFHKKSQYEKKKLSESTEFFGRNPKTMPPMMEIYDIYQHDRKVEPNIKRNSSFTKKSRKPRNRPSTAPPQRPISHPKKQNRSGRSSAQIPQPQRNIPQPLPQFQFSEPLKKLPHVVCDFLRKLQIFNPLPVKVQDWRNGVNLANLVSRLEMVDLKGIDRTPTRKPQILHNLNQALTILRTKKGFKSTHLFETLHIQEGDPKAIIGLLKDIHRHYRKHYLTLQPKRSSKRRTTKINSISSIRSSSAGRRRFSANDLHPPPSGGIASSSTFSKQQQKRKNIPNHLIRKTDSFLTWLESIGYKKMKINPRVFYNPSTNVLRDPLRNGSFLRELIEFLEDTHNLPRFFWKKNSTPRVVTDAESRVQISVTFLKNKSHRFNSISSHQIVEGNRGVYYTIQQVYKNNVITKSKKKKSKKPKNKNKIKKKNKKNVDLRSRSFLLEQEEEKKYYERREHILEMKKQLMTEKRILTWLDRIGVLEDEDFLLSPNNNNNKFKKPSDTTLPSRNYRRLREGLTPSKKKKNNRGRPGKTVERMKDLDVSLRDGKILCRIATIFKRRNEGFNSPEVYYQYSRGLEHISLANINRAFAYFREDSSCKGLINRRYLFKDSLIFKGNKKVTIGLLLDLMKFDRIQRKKRKGNEFETYMFGDQDSKKNKNKNNQNKKFNFFEDQKQQKQQQPKKNRFRTPKKNKNKNKNEGISLNRLIELSVFEDDEELNRSLGREEEVSRRMRSYDEEESLKRRGRSRFEGLENWVLKLNVISRKNRESFTLESSNTDNDNDNDGPLGIFNDGILLYKIVKKLERKRGSDIDKMIKGGKIDLKPKKKAHCLFNIRKVMNVLKENREMDLTNLWSEDDIYEGRQSVIIKLLKDIKKAYRNNNNNKEG